jgi:SPP1 gp7 family putative phage head morphogenesis protein
LAGLEIARQKWKNELVDAKRPFYLAMADDGYRWAGAELGDRDDIESLIAGKAWTEPEIDPNLMSRRVVDYVDEFIEDMSEYESKTTSRQIADKFNDLRSRPETFTPTQVRDRLAASFADVPLHRADRITRTSTIWTYNRGAREAYTERGITRYEWMVTADDRTCEHCLPLDGKTVGQQEMFASKGDTLTGLEGGDLDIAWNIEHPPLHAHCRCALLPVTEDIV